ncbi:hypothetical protein H0H92_001024, partial [Tricholoma furcatifolium]
SSTAGCKLAMDFASLEPIPYQVSRREENTGAADGSIIPDRNLNLLPTSSDFPQHSHSSSNVDADLIFKQFDQYYRSQLAHGQPSQPDEFLLSPIESQEAANHDWLFGDQACSELSSPSFSYSLQYEQGTSGSDFNTYPPNFPSESFPPRSEVPAPSSSYSFQHEQGNGTRADSSTHRLNVPESFVPCSELRSPSSSYPYQYGQGTSTMVNSSTYSPNVPSESFVPQALPFNGEPSIHFSDLVPSNTPADSTPSDGSLAVTRRTRAPRKFPRHAPSIRQLPKFTKVGVLCDIIFRCQWGICRNKTVFKLDGRTEEDQNQFQDTVLDHLKAHVYGNTGVFTDAVAGSMGQGESDCNASGPTTRCKWKNCKLTPSEKKSELRDMLRHVQQHLDKKWKYFCPNAGCEYYRSREVKDKFHSCKFGKVGK